METKLEQPVPYDVGTMIKMIIGAFLVLLGILLIAGNLGLNTWPLMRYWPLVLVVIGLLKVLAPSGPLFGAVLVVAGGWMTAYNLHVIRFTIFDLWPLVLICCGVVMVIRAFGVNPVPRRFVVAGGGNNVVAILSSRNVVETSRDYSGGSVFSFLGGSQIDLSGAAMTRRPAVIDATAILGAVEILAPDDWVVSGDAVPVMGAFEMKCQSGASASGGELVVRGVAFMGGIEVKSVRRTS